MEHYEEFYETIKFIEQWLQSTNLQNDYLNLNNQINNFRQNTNNVQFRSAINSSIAEVAKKQAMFSFPKNWNPTLNQIFKKIEADKNIGSNAITQLNRTTNLVSSGNANAVIELTAVINEFNSFRTKISQSIIAFNNLSVWNDIKIKPEIPNGKMAIQITFKENASISNLQEMQSYADEWIKIVSAFYRLEDLIPEDVEVADVKRGSLIMTLLGKAAAVKKAAIAVKEILEVVKLVMDLKNLQTGVKNQEGEIGTEGAKQVDKVLKDAIMKKIESKSGEIADRLYKDSPASSNPNNGDVRNAVADALKRVMRFSENGGSVDFLQNDEDEKQNPEQTKLFNDIKEMKIQIDKVNIYIGHSGDKPNN